MTSKQTQKIPGTALPADQGARDRALSPRASFHLEAPAGSGKTSVLLARFLTLLAQVEVPEELLALTFTRKAAGELRSRVTELLWPREERPPEHPWEQRLAAGDFRPHPNPAPEDDKLGACQYCPHALLCGFSQAARPEAEEEESE